MPVAFGGRITGDPKMEFIGFDGKKIHVHEWLNVSSPRGVVQIIHGMAEHAARYEKFAAFLNANGFVVVADDHRGHGETDPATPGYSDGDMFADTVKDEEKITDRYKSMYPGVKYFVLGFSYGSFLTQSYIASYGDKIDGAVIAGSNYKKDFDVYFGSLFAFFANLSGLSRNPAGIIERASFGAYEKQTEDGNWISADDENNAAYKQDPMCGFVCSYRFYADFFRGLRKLYTRSYAKKLDKELPLFLVAGADDPVGEKGKGMKKLFSFYKNKAGVRDVELKLFDGSRHEFLNEKKNRDEKWGAVLDFFERHM